MNKVTKLAATLASSLTLAAVTVPGIAGATGRTSYNNDQKSHTDDKRDNKKHDDKNWDWKEKEFCDCHKQNHRFNKDMKRKWDWWNKCCLHDRDNNKDCDNKNKRDW